MTAAHPSVPPQPGEELLWDFFEIHEKVDNWFLTAKADIARIDPSAVTQEQIDALTTAMLVESDNPVYMLELLKALRSHQYLAAFIPIWGEEEVKHFLILKLTLIRLGVDAALLDQMIDQVRQTTWEIPTRYTPAMISAYTTVQEQLTALFYEGVADRCREPIVQGILRRIAKDERRHHAYYRKLTKSFIAADATGQTKNEVREALMEFEMPGAILVENYEDRAALMVKEAGITMKAGQAVVKTVHDFLGSNPLVLRDVLWNSVLGQQARSMGWDIPRLARQVVFPAFGRA